MLLNNQQISEAVRKGNVVIEPYEESQLQGASYDLRVGDEGATSSARKKMSIREQGFLILAPGDFAVLASYEKLQFDKQHTARIGLRSKFARKGLVATTGLQIDPGFRGRLMVGLLNLTPKEIVLPHKDDLLSIEFHRLEAPSEKPYSGPYQGRDQLGPEELETVLGNEGMVFSEVLTTIRGLSQNVAHLDKTVTALGTKINLVFWVLGVLVVPVLLIFIGYMINFWQS